MASLSSSQTSVTKQVEKSDDDDVKSVSAAAVAPPTATPEQNSDVEKASTKAGAPAAGSPNDDIPNGGLTAWLQVLGSFFLMFNSWGLVNTFGVFQAYYTTQLLPDDSPSNISWIGSIQVFLLLFVGTLTGPIYDAGYFRALLLGGSFMVVFGLMMISLCTTYWQLMLAQAIVIGLGCGMLFVPSVAILSTYFSTHVAFAIGMGNAGSSIGGTIYPIVFRRLQPTIGFPWATRVIGFIALGTLLISLSVMKVRVLPQQRRAMLDLPAFKYPPYTLFCVAAFLCFIGLYVPFFYIQSFAITSNFSSADLSFYTLSIMNAGSTFGRIIPGFLADIIGPFNMTIPITFSAGILILCLMAVHSVAPLIVIAVLYGFCSGAFVSLPPATIIRLSPNRALIGTHMGMAFTFVSIGILIGPPSTGAILRMGGFQSAWIFGGVFVCCAGVVMTIARASKVGWNPMINT